MKHTYSNDRITVGWEPEKCMHAGECVRGLPSVFDLSKRPWVTIDGAPAKEIAAVIDRCPSKALTYELK